jgi:hypothetical protein
MLIDILCVRQAKRSRLRLHWNVDYLFRALNFLGWLLMYCAVFLYEDQEGRVQNKIVEWWVKVDDARIVAHSRAAAFLTAVARLTARGFDRVLGERLISLRFAGVSLCLSIASVSLITAFGTIRLHQSPRGPLFLSACLVAAALVPAFGESRWVLRLWGLLLFVAVLRPFGYLLFILYSVRGIAFAGRTLGYVALPLAVSFACDVSYVSLTRWMLRKVSSGSRVYEVVLLAAVNLLILYLIFLGPIQLGAKVSQYWQGGGAAIMLSFCLNAIDFFAGSAALLLAVSLLIHRLFWPVVEKPLYALQRYGVISNKKLLWGAGLALAFLPTHMAVGVLRLLIEKLAGAVGA